MRKRNIALWALTPVAVALVLSGCGSGSDNDLAVDNNAQSCSVVSSSGSAVVVGSGAYGQSASSYQFCSKRKLILPAAPPLLKSSETPARWTPG